MQLIRRWTGDVHPNPRRFLAATALLGIFSASLPSAAIGQAARPAGVTDLELYGTVIRNSKWKTLEIAVCWENPSAGDAGYRAIVRSAVEDTWVRHSRIKFVGWGSCKSDSPGIRIKIADEGPHTKAIGRYLDRRPEGMILNFSFEHWQDQCKTTRDHCISAVAVHEFGHALGFTHEQNRADAPKECRNEKASGSVGDYNVTKYDAFSIMNYCNPLWLGDGKLSSLDIEAVREFYSN